MKTIIIGGSATGMGVAARLRRNDANMEIEVFQKNSYVSLGACGLPYFVADNFQDSNKLIARTIDKFEEGNIKIHANTLVTEINYEKKQIKYINEGKESYCEYDNLVLSVGAKPIVPNVKNNDHKNVYTLTSLEDGVTLKEDLKSDKIKKVAVIGAGFIGLEITESLRHLNKQVSLIEMSDRVSPRVYDTDVSEMIQDELVKQDVDLRLNSQLSEIVVDNNIITAVKLSDGTLIECDAVVMAVGFTPNTEFLKNNKLSIDLRGAIIVDQYGKTNIDNVWSAGDCATSKHFITGEDIYSPLATVASKFARVIADNISGKTAKFIGSLQTAIVRVFDKEIARTGLTEQDCILKKIDYKIVNITDKDHTHYVPNQSDLFLKIIMNNQTKEIIGAQMVGQDKSVLRINGLVSLIWTKAKVDEILEQIDLPYAPPFAKTTDIIHIALSKLLK